MKTNKIKIALLIGIPVLIAFFASRFASGSPDALESVAIMHGFEEHALETSGFFADYTFLTAIVALAALFVFYRFTALVIRKR